MLIGETTYGKAVGLSNWEFFGDKLVLATMTLELPKTGDYNDEGIHPNFVVENETVSVDPVLMLPVDSEEIIPESNTHQILAMEQRLLLLGYLFSPADGIWDEQTDEALEAFFSAAGKAYTGSCDAEMLDLLSALVQDYLDAKYPEDTQLDFAYRYLKEKQAAQAA